MKILCISASNVVDHKANSASTKTCELIQKIIIENYGGDFTFETAVFSNLDMKPCVMCGKCQENYSCSFDKDFNWLFSRILESDAVFLVCPHYAPIPSKVMIMLEKLQEFAYISYCAGRDKDFPINGKHISIIAHGGQRRDYEDCYKKAILQPLNGAFAAAGFDVVGAAQEGGVGLEDGNPRGAVFGISDMKKVDNSLLPEMVHDWKDIEKRISPLVYSMIKVLKAAK